MRERKGEISSILPFYCMLFQTFTVSALKMPLYNWTLHYSINIHISYFTWNVIESLLARHILSLLFYCCCYSVHIDTDVFFFYYIDWDCHQNCIFERERKKNVPLGMKEIKSDNSLTNFQYLNIISNISSFL